MTYSQVHWQASFERELDGLSAAAVISESSRTAEITDRLQSVRAAVVDIITIPIVYLAGFNGIAAGSLSSSAGVSAAVKHWVRNVPRDRSATRLAGLTSTALCSLLEDFIVDLATAKIDPGVIARLRAQRQLPADEAEARSRLASLDPGSARGSPPIHRGERMDAR
jgi:hypothetical protein